MANQAPIMNLDTPALGRSLAALARLDEAGAPSFQAATAFLGSARRLGDFCRSYGVDLVVSGVEPYELADLCRNVDAISEWLSRATLILDRRVRELDD
jgi:hypothetical protein